MTGDSNISSGRMQNFLRYFGHFMVIFYVGAGIALLLPGETFDLLTPAIRIVLGIVLILYGIFRLWRVIKTDKYEKPD